ncbi:hypothetical protein [Nannocystis radixulma]|uniref:Uncharacterized protein n=1 Tax=Nannocystis radixulma TaxID=2995305 RepID=A0ABT5B6T1_9BACT|nr:hypothetical protein [Nannocystis radixulma]MDC0669370.1 hypothetical protein [Nannocystis radixulma]
MRWFFGGNVGAAFMAGMLLHCADEQPSEKVAGEYAIRLGPPVPLPMAGDIGLTDIAETDCYLDRVFNGYRSAFDYHLYTFGAGCTSMNLTY